MPSVTIGLCRNSTYPNVMYRILHASNPAGTRHHSIVEIGDVDD